MHKAQSETQKQCSPKSDHAIGGTATNPTPRRAFTTMKSLNIRLNLVNETDASMNLQGTTASKLERGLTPPVFSEAVESMHQANLRQGISLGTIRPPQRLAPFSHAIGLEVDHLDKENTPTDSEGDAFGRLILLHDPGAQESWEGEMRLVAYIQADMESAVATDPLLPDVAWQWLEEGLETHSAGYTNLGGTVTSTTSVRFGEVGGPPRAYQLELRASWTAKNNQLADHVDAFAEVLAHVAGLPPEGVSQLRR